MTFCNQGNILFYLVYRHFKYQIFSTKPCGSQEINWKYPILFDHAKTCFSCSSNNFQFGPENNSNSIFSSIRGDSEEHTLAKTFLSIEYWKQVILRSNSKRFSFSLCLPVYRPSKSQNLPPKSHNCARPNVFTKENVQCKYLQDNNEIFKYGVEQQHLRKTNI